MFYNFSETQNWLWFSGWTQKHQAFIRNEKPARVSSSSTIDPSSASCAWHQSHRPLAQFAFRGAFPSRAALYSMTNSMESLIMAKTRAMSDPNLRRLTPQSTEHCCAPQRTHPSRGPLGEIWGSQVGVGKMMSLSLTKYPQRSTLLVHTSLLDVRLGEAGYPQFIKEHDYLKGEINSR